MNSELAAIDWLGRGWLMMLAFTVAVLLVAALRKPCRHLFGTERAFQLWLLPPLAMLVSQLPHAAVTQATVFSAMVSTITSMARLSPAPAVSVHVVDWRAWALALWLAGITFNLLLAVRAQARYGRRLHGALPVPGSELPCPVMRATTANIGPALVGAWQCRIVLPADFEQRYTDVEQALILAHEATHARRRDGWWCLCARVFAAGFWFHPLAWWALSALRRDQELACDAAVLRIHGEQRRSYANAMLKTQSAVFALPVGCTWSSPHPLTERIAMLKLSAPNRRRQQAGMFAGFALAMLVVGSVYAASAPPQVPPSQKAHGTEYQLDMQVELATTDGHHRHAENVYLVLCTAPDKAAVASVNSVAVEATTVPVGVGRVRIDLAVGNTGAAPFAHSQLHGVLGQTLHAAGPGRDGKHSYAIDVTPQAGCPARTIAEASPVKVTEHVTNGTTRAVAESIAAKAGWTLVNPDALGHGAVTLSFNDMPAGTALQRVADLAGMNLVLDGKRVRFAPK